VINLDPQLPRWPTATITIIAGGFVAIVTAAWIWSHAVRGAVIDDVAVIIAAATVARAVSIGVSFAGLAQRPVLPRMVNTALAGFGAAQLIYPVAEAAVKVLVVVGIVESSPAGVRNLSGTGWFNFAAVVVVFGVPGVMFQIQTRQHARRHAISVRYNAIGGVAGVLALTAIGVAVGTE
jgi:hypothetical protein